MKRLLVLGGAVTLLVLFAAGPAASAATETRSQGAVPNAAINGFARASAGFVPFSVNPNFDFWPVYSLSETDGSLSHGVSAGFWPGFLADATFFQFGYQPAERAFFGAAESAYPIGPVDDAAGSTDFDRLCAAGQVSNLPLPLGLGEGAAPEPLLTGCRSLYTQYRSRVPYSAASGRTTSDLLRSEGSANGAELRFGTVTAGAAYVTSYTNGADGSNTQSGATVILSDVAIGATIRIKEIRSSVLAAANGVAAGAKTERSLTIVEATSGGQPVIIDGNGVSTPNGDSLNGVLAAQGLQVRIVDGTTDKDARHATVSSGALVVRAARDMSGTLGDADKTCSQVSAAYPKPVATVHQTIAPNPVYSPQPPYDQVPPTIAVDEQILPVIPCPLLLLERSADVGIALAGATASARFQPLPDLGVDGGGATGDSGSPTSGNGGGFVFRGGTSSGGTSSGGTSSGGTGPLLPSFGTTPPVPLESITKPYIFEGLGGREASGVKAIYGALILVLIGLVAGRRGFKGMTRA